MTMKLIVIASGRNFEGGKNSCSGDWSISPKNYCQTELGRVQELYNLAGGLLVKW